MYICSMTIKSAGFYCAIHAQLFQKMNEVFSQKGGKGRRNKRREDWREERKKGTEGESQGSRRGTHDRVREAVA